MNEQTELTQYDELAIKHNAALIAYRSMYEAHTPQPQEPVTKRDNLITLGVLATLILASIIVSGSRTIPEFGGGIVGISAFIMLECSIVIFAFLRTRRNFTKERLKDVIKLARRGLVLAFVVTVAANIDKILTEKSLIESESVQTAIFLLVSVSAPTLAFISGDMLAIESMAYLQKVQGEQRDYDKKLKAWKRDFMKSWNSQKSRFGVTVTVEKTPVNSLNLIKNNQLMARNKPSPKLEKAKVYLGQHEEYWYTAPRELEEMGIPELGGISYGTIFKAQKILRGESTE